MTKEELIKSYIEQIKNSKNPKDEIKKIIREIDNLKYENSNTNISDADKIALIKGINRHFKLIEESTEVYKSFSQDRTRICSATDNSEIIKMLDNAENAIRG